MEQLCHGNKLQFGGLGKVSGGMKRQAQVLDPLECAITSKLIRHSTGRGNKKISTSVMGADITPPNDTGYDQTFKLNGELLHGGKGKDNTLVNIDCNHNTMGEPVWQPQTSGWEGLQLPRLETMRGAVYEDNKTQMQKENKHH
jgi:hypothetical protein